MHLCIKCLILFHIGTVKDISKQSIHLQNIGYENPTTFFYWEISLSSKMNITLTFMHVVSIFSIWLFLLLEDTLIHCHMKHHYRRFTGNSSIYEHKATASNKS